MPFYKSPDGFLHFLSHEDIDNDGELLLPVGSVQITDAEAESIRAANSPKPTAEQIRSDRDSRLARCDWTQLADTALTSAQKTAWKTYRQALRDVTEQPGFPESVEWPVAP